MCNLWPSWLHASHLPPARVSRLRVGCRHAGALSLYYVRYCCTNRVRLFPERKKNVGWRSLYVLVNHTTNRQQNTQTQHPRHGEKPGINMTQATTTTVCIKNTTDVWNLTPANINTNTSTAYDTSNIKVDITDTMVLCKIIRSSYVYNVIPTRILIISYNHI